MKENIIMNKEKEEERRGSGARNIEHLKLLFMLSDCHSYP
jgi:hypothetical protein